MKTSILYIFLLSVLYACDSHSLLPPKQQLDQQIAQLNDYSLLSGRLNDQLCEEIETHAQEIGNDSLLLATRQISNLTLAIADYRTRLMRECYSTA